MESELTPEEHQEACIWLEAARSRILETQAAGLDPHYLTAGSRVWWLLTCKGIRKQPVFGLAGVTGPTIPIFPMNPAAQEFPVPKEGIHRPLHGIAVVAREKSVAP